MRNWEFLPPTHLCPQMTQITQIKAKPFGDVICVICGKVFDGTKKVSRSMAERIYQLMASGIPRYEILFFTP